MEDVGAGVGARTDNPVDLLRFVFVTRLQV